MLKILKTLFTHTVVASLGVVAGATAHRLALVHVGDDYWEKVKTDIEMDRRYYR